jgi:hypothetical protein
MRKATLFPFCCCDAYRLLFAGRYCWGAAFRHRYLQRLPCCGLAVAIHLWAGGCFPVANPLRGSGGDPAVGRRRRRPAAGWRRRPGCGPPAATPLRAGGCDHPAVRLRRRPGSRWAVGGDGRLRAGAGDPAAGRRQRSVCWPAWAIQWRPGCGPAGAIILLFACGGDPAVGRRQRSGRFPQSRMPATIEFSIKLFVCLSGRGYGSCRCPDQSVWTHNNKVTGDKHTIAIREIHSLCQIVGKETKLTA